jgi:hypothetical protein
MQRSVLCLVPEGSHGLHAQRAKLLTQRLQQDTDAEITTYYPTRDQGRATAIKETSQLLRQKFDMVYMEGTGIGTGLPLISAGRRGQKYIVSSGDPIKGFFQNTQGKAAATFFGWYEKQLMLKCRAFVGWTPYLSGRAMELGAKRAATIEGGADLSLFSAPSPEAKLAARQSFGLHPDHIVCVVVGSLLWSQPQKYTYGLELVEMLKFIQRPDVSVLIVGDGNGRKILESRVPTAMKNRIVFTGRIDFKDVPKAFHASDIGFVTQTLDGLGNYRLTTKLPEYLASGLGVAMSPIPGFYDYVLDAGWALPEAHPNSEKFHRGCAALLDSLQKEDITRKSATAVTLAAERFDYDALAGRFSQFVQDLW